MTCSANSGERRVIGIAGEGDRLPMSSVPAAVASVHGALRRVPVPVLWGVAAIAAGTLVWWIEDPMMRRVKG
jgi:hypothetical protein